MSKLYPIYSVPYNSSSVAGVNALVADESLEAAAQRAYDGVLEKERGRSTINIFIHKIRDTGYRADKKGILCFEAERD